VEIENILNWLGDGLIKKINTNQDVDYNEYLFKVQCIMQKLTLIRKDRDIKHSEYQN